MNFSRPARVRFGDVWIDSLTMGGAVTAIEALVDSGQGGMVFTPNIDHVVVADQSPDFRSAYSRADLSLCDGTPLYWTSGLVGHWLPEKVSGSDLFLPLMKQAARRNFRVYLLGAGEGVAAEAAVRMERELGVNVVGTSAPRIGLEAGPDEGAVIDAIAATRPDLVLCCLGTPKGELFVDRVRARLSPAVAVSMGATLDFYMGRVRRAPRRMQQLGLEWFYRLWQEPRRLARRYLLQDPKFFFILLSTLRSPRAERVSLPTLRAPRT